MLKQRKILRCLALLLAFSGILVAPANPIFAQNTTELAQEQKMTGEPLKSSQLWINITAYKETDGLQLEDFNYDYEGTYAENPGVKLANGVYKIQTVLEEEDEYDREVYEEGKRVSYRFFGFQEATSTPIYRQGDKLYADLIIKEAKPAKEAYNIIYMHKGAELFKQELQVAYPVDDEGNTIHDEEASIGKNLGDTVSFAGQSYRIKQVKLEEKDFTVELESVNFIDLTIQVIPQTTMQITANRSDRWSFSINGQTYQVSPYAGRVSGNNGFSLTFTNIPLGESQTPTDLDIQALALPEDWQRSFSIAGQSYDTSSKKLTVNIGRKLYIKVSNIKAGANYQDFAEKHHVPGFILDLFDTQGNFLYKSLLASTQFGKMAMFPALLPGSYQIKVASAPDGYASYDMSRTYKLEIAPDGMPKLEVYQRDSHYNLARANGSLDHVEPTDPLLNGVKTPLLLLLPKVNPPEKEVVVNGEGTQKLEVGKDDIVTFKIHKTISPDHNAVVSYGSYVNIGTRLDQGFEDKLDPRLTFQEGSLSLTLDGQPTEDFIASYKPQSHSIEVKDVSQVKLHEIDFNKAIELDPEKKLELTFKVKVKESDEEIINKVGDSTVRLIPFKITVKKAWQDGNNLYGNRPEFIELKLLKNGQVYRTVRVKPDREGLWSYTFKDLPKVENENEIVYTLAEVDIPGYTQAINQTGKNEFTVTNTLKTVKIEGKKNWVDNDNQAGKRPASITVILKADGLEKARKIVTENDHWQWSFEDLPEFVNRKKVVYTIEELAVEGYDSKVEGYDITNQKQPEPTPTTTRPTKPTKTTETTKPTPRPTPSSVPTGSKPTLPKPGLPKTGEADLTPYAVMAVIFLQALIAVIVKRLKTSDNH